MLLQVKNVTVSYGDVEALHNIHLDVDAGNLVSLIGPNGAGKTTVLRSISGLIKLKEGEIWFEGDRIDGLPAEEIVKRGMACVPEGRRVFPHMTVLENLEMGAYSQKSQKDFKRHVLEVYDYFHVLQNRKSQQAGSLSGGEQQMLAVGRALMSKPKAILMDEPSMGLSPLMCKVIGTVIKDINESGRSILLVEQNALMALNLSQRAYVLELGRILIEADAASLLEDERIKKAYLGA